MPLCAALVVSCVILSAGTVPGAEADPGKPERLPEALVSTITVEVRIPSSPTIPPIDEARRPAVLPMLYVSLAGLQVYDAYSTTRGLSQGARELNPVMRGIAGNSVALWTVKAATTASSIWVAERLWKRNRTAAIVTMVALNGVVASVATHNWATLRRMDRASIHQ
jgi:hypothetical protein